MAKYTRFYCVLLFGIATSPVAAQERTTRWTGGGGNNLWFNSLNWTTGVPDAETVALFTGTDASGVVVDLGGATGRAARIDTYMGIGSRATFRNGTLSTPHVNAASGVRIESNLTTDAPSLLLSAGMDLTVTGRIVGTMDVYASGTFTGFQLYPGRTTVRESLTVADGAIFQSPVNVPGGRLVLAGEVLVDDVRLAGGLIAAAVPSNARVDTLRFDSGQSAVVVESGSLEASAILRSPGATVALNPTTIGATGRLRADTLPPLAGDGSGPDRLGVAPWVVGPIDGGFGRVFATYNGAGTNPGFRPLDPATEHAATLAPGANVRLGADVAQAADVAVNTLNLNGASVTLNNATLTVSGGGLIMTGGSTERASILGTGTLALPASEGIVHVVKPRTGDEPSGTFSIDVPITGGMLTKSGNGELLLTRQNGYAGGTTINGGTLAAVVPGALGAGPIRLDGGSLRLAYDNPVLVQDIALGSQASTNLTVRPGTVRLDGTVFGVGRLVIGTGEGAGPATVRLAGGGAATGTYHLSVGRGTLFIDGNYASPDATILTGTTTFGTGTVRGELWNTGNTLSPGDGPDDPGRMSVGRLSLYRGTLQADIAGRDPGAGYDQLVVLDRTFIRTDPFIDSVLQVVPALGFSPLPGDRFVLIDNRFSGPVDGYFQGLTEGTTFTAGGSSWRITYAGGDGNDVVVSVVPEPHALGAMTLAAIGLLRRRRR